MRYVRHAFIIFLIAIPLFFLFNSWHDYNQEHSPTYITEKVIATEPKVYVTDYGDCYHNVNCQYLWNSANPKGLYQAQEQGFLACSICKGRASGTIEVTYFKKVVKEYNESTVNVLAIFLSGLSALMIYLFVYVTVHNYKEDKEINDMIKNSSLNKKK